MPPTKPRDVLLRKRLELFTKMLHGVEDGDARALHRARIESRRLRELVPILQLPNDLARKLGRRLRRVTKRLGQVRELDVLTTLLNYLQQSGRYSGAALTRVGNAVALDRDEAHERLGSRLPKAELGRLADKLADAARTLEAGHRASNRRHAATRRWAVEARIARRAERLSGAIREAGAVYLPERLHAVRIAVKKLRYGVELAEEMAGDRCSADLRALKQSQDVLGRMHDLQVLIDRVRQLQAGSDDLSTERALEAMVDTLENDCRRLHARFVRARTVLLAICARPAVRARSVWARRLAARRAGARRAG